MRWGILERGVLSCLVGWTQGVHPGGCYSSILYSHGRRTLEEVAPSTGLWSVGQHLTECKDLVFVALVVGSGDGERLPSSRAKTWQESAIDSLL